MQRHPDAFLSYAHIDNTYGNLTELRERLSNEVHVQTGVEFPIFQDREDILLGQNWRERIVSALEEQVKFLIPILTPSFFNSPACREELELFLRRETALRRNDLILPIYYVSCRQLEREEYRASDPLAQAIASRQWGDWRGLRFEPFDSPEVCKTIMRLAGQIQLAIERVVPIPKVMAPPTKEQTCVDSISVEVFTAFVRKDAGIAEQMRWHLTILLQQGLISHWQIRLNVEPQLENPINSLIESASIILLLVSPDFLASDYCYGAEMRRALERHESGDATVIPIIVRACDWGGTPFAKLQALPRDGRPINTWANRDKALMDVMEGIKTAIRHLTKQ